MKKGFTLAEVLITLAIIGVVAALTIPVVVNNYQKKAQYTAFMKMYNIVTNVLSLSEGEYGKPGAWDYDSSNPQATVEKYIYPYLKIASECDISDNANACSIPYDMKSLAGDDITGYWQLLPNVVLMQDGSVIAIHTGKETRDGVAYLSGFSFFLDINGKKGPNILGRDIFLINYSNSANANREWAFHTTGDMGASNCDPSNSNSDGSGCSTRLLQEGKMNY